MIVLIDGVRYQLITPESEASLEKAIQSNHQYVFGPDSFYFDIKKMIRSKAGVASIPDGYVIYFTPKPKWAIVEVELASHPIYDHLIPQLTKFNRGIEDNATRRQLVDILYGIFNENEVLKAKLKQKIKSGEVYKFISDLVSESPLIAVIIDQKKEELEEALRDIRGDVQVVEFKTFRREGASEGMNAFVFEPLFWSSISDTVKVNTGLAEEPINTPNVHDPISEADYRAKYRKQLDNPNSMASKIRRYVQERGKVRFKDLEEVIVNEWDYKISGSVGACLTILEQGKYIRIEGRGDNKVLRATKSRG